MEISTCLAKLTEGQPATPRPVQESCRVAVVDSVLRAPGPAQPRITAAGPSRSEGSDPASRDRHQDGLRAPVAAPCEAARLAARSHRDQHDFTARLLRRAGGPSHPKLSDSSITSLPSLRGVMLRSSAGGSESESASHRQQRHTAILHDSRPRPAWRREWSAGLRARRRRSTAERSTAAPVVVIHVDASSRARRWSRSSRPGLIACAVNGSFINAASTETKRCRRVSVLARRRQPAIGSGRHR